MIRSICLIVFAFSLTVLTTGFQNTLKTKKDNYDWTQIKEFRFYGFEDPSEKKDAASILADADKIKTIFQNLKKSEGYIPKGASRFAVITFNNKKKITIQIIAGGTSPFRVMDKDVLSDNWFDFEENRSSDWTTYIRELTDQFKK